MPALPPNVFKLDYLEANHPRLFNIMKKYNKSRFEPVGFFIVSQPQTHPNHQVYGIFVVDKNEVAKKLKNPNNICAQIKQDFLVYDQESHSVKYYRGLIRGERADTILRPISQFCSLYGGGGKYYDTFINSKNRWQTRLHHFCDERDPRLPIEPHLRNKVKRALDKVLQDLGKSNR